MLNKLLRTVYQCSVPFEQYVSQLLWHFSVYWNEIIIFYFILDRGRFVIRQIKEKWIKKISFPGGGSLVFIHNKKKPYNITISGINLKPIIIFTYLHFKQVKYNIDLWDLWKKERESGCTTTCLQYNTQCGEEKKLCFSMILEGFTLFGLISWNNFILYQMGLYK